MNIHLRMKNTYYVVFQISFLKSTRGAPKKPKRSTVYLEPP